MQMKRIFRITILSLIAAAAMSLAGCREESNPEYSYSDKLVTRVYINTELSVNEGQSLIIQGRGFLAGDLIVFRSASDEVSITVDKVTDTYATFIVPDGMKRGEYDLYVVRGDLEQKICKVSIWITASFDIPDRTGCNIKGVVYCEDTGVSGVVVSDGYQTTVTDSNGYFWLASQKQNGYVFITIPSGYMPVSESNASPSFWVPVTSETEVTEQCVFELQRVENDTHYVIFATDLHLANRDSSNADMSQFRNGFMVDSQALAAQYGVDRTYAVVLGDLTWDHYWYVQHYTPADYLETVADYCVPMFNVMGNHDNDPYVQGDFAGEAFYKSCVGPSYYSFDIGQVHYIVLDNVAWINTGGAQGVIGSRDYRRQFSDAQLEWLRNDLSRVSDKDTPIVLCTHCPLYSNHNSSFENTPSLSDDATAELIGCLTGFTNVHIMTGHTHYNGNMVISDNIFEHNTAAVCECWWWGGKYSGRSVCKDGTPSGYGVFEVTGRDIKWYYKGIGCERDEQFRTYDMNVVKNYLSNYVETLNKQTNSPRDTAGDDYGSLGSNIVYINIWNYDPSWTIEVTENGASLQVTRVFDRDPLHTLCYDIPRVQNGGELTTDNASNRNSHMFAVQASGPATTLTVKVTDRFGETYTETMTRPKAFTTQMK